MKESRESIENKSLNEENESNQNTSENNHQIEQTKLPNQINENVYEHHVEQAQQLSVSARDRSRKEIPSKFEIHSNKLILRGSGCANMIYRRWNVATINEVDTILFVYVNFEEISPHIEKLSSVFNNLQNLEFHGTYINNLLQISSISSAGYLHALVLSEENNPVTQLSLWRSYTIYKINTLKWLNGIQVTAEELEKSAKTFRGLPISPTKTYRNHQLKKQFSTRKMSIQYEEDEDDDQTSIENHDIQTLIQQGPLTVSKSLMEKVMENLSHSLLVHNLIQQHWPSVVEEIVAEAVNDFQDMDEHMRQCLNRFHLNKKCDKSKNKLPFRP
ncbi:Leucine-rich repeat-containing protein 49 [Chamberlinius hualienensis]